MIWWIQLQLIAPISGKKTRHCCATKECHGWEGLRDVQLSLGEGHWTRSWGTWHLQYSPCNPGRTCWSTVSWGKTNVFGKTWGKCVFCIQFMQPSCTPEHFSRRSLKKYMIKMFVYQGQPFCEICTSHLTLALAWTLLWSL